MPSIPLPPKAPHYTMRDHPPNNQISSIPNTDLFVWTLSSVKCKTKVDRLIDYYYDDFMKASFLLPLNSEKWLWYIFISMFVTQEGYVTLLLGRIKFSNIWEAASRIWVGIILRLHCLYFFFLISKKILLKEIGLEY